MTEINGRRVDIKKAEPKEKGSGPPVPGGGKPSFHGGHHGGGGGGGGGGGHSMGQGPAVIPPYG